MSKKRENKILEKVTLQKIGPHVKVTEGPYSKRELRELLLSSVSLFSGDNTEDREKKLIRLSDVDAELTHGTGNDEEIASETDKSYSKNAKKSANVEDEKIGKQEKLHNLLSGKGISDRLIERISSNGLNEETIRLLKALGLNDDEIAELVGMLERSMDQGDVESMESCLSVGSSSEEYFSIHGFYLLSNFRNPLTKGLGDVANKKPRNPAEYLGHWLLNYKICEERSQKQKEFEAELEIEREKIRFQVNVEPNVSEVDQLDEEEGEEGLEEDRNFVDYEAD